LRYQLCFVSNLQKEVDDELFTSVVHGS
jgi:hypothetical protein